ncbi:MAG: chromosomal replication initiator DnaA [Sphingomonadales bacterium]
MIQAGLPLDWPADEAEDSFIVTPSNERAVRHIERPGTWPVAATLLVGPRKSGRSLLGRMFVQRSGGRFIDDADRRDERMLFNAWNDAQSTRQPLLMVADAPPPVWQVSLPDLASRLSATSVVEIGEPDESLIGALLERLLARRGLPLAPEVVAYLVPRAPRSHATVIALADALDAASLARKRGITVPLARDVLGLAE